MSRSTSTLTGSAGTARLFGTGLLAGLAGGTAEILWIGLVAPATGQDGAAISRGVTETVLPWLAEPALALAVGIAIHMGLAVLLGLAIAFALRAALPARLHGSLAEFGTVVLVLVGVWGFNFFVALPALNPHFLDLVPYWTAFVSKALFGVAAAMVILRRR